MITNSKCIKKIKKATACLLFVVFVADQILLLSFWTKDLVKLYVICI